MSIQRRLYDCASFGGPYVDAGLGHDHANAHFGLVNGTLDGLIELAAAIPDSRELPLVSLIAMVIECNGDELATRAAVMQWHKRKTAYDADAAAWRAAEPYQGDGWRARPMTAPQRHLIADTAQILVIDVPEGMDRGAAADWLNAQGAHLIHRLGGTNE